MPDIVLKTVEDVEDFVNGCGFYGVGGGGQPELGRRVLLEDLPKVGEIVITGPESIRDDAWVCTSFGPGSVAPSTPENQAKMASLGLNKKIGLADRMYALAILELQNYANVEIDAILASELGGFDGTPASVDAALSLGKKIVNGDLCGRAVPEASMSTACLAGLPDYPSAYVDPWGNVVIVRKTINYAIAETLSKMISVAACSYIGGAGFLMRGREMKKVLIPNTLSECLNYGHIIRKAVSEKADPADAVAKATQGWVIFQGKVSSMDWHDRDGYMWGTNTIKGEGEFEGHTMKIWYKNENHITWLDGKYYVTSPDLISVIRKTDGMPLTNTDIREGDVVSILGLKARDPFRTEKGIEMLGPRHFGYDLNYTPIEQILR